MKTKFYKSLYNVSCIDETDDSILCIMHDENEEWWSKNCIDMKESEITKLGDTGILLVERDIARMKGY